MACGPGDTERRVSALAEGLGGQPVAHIPSGGCRSEVLRKGVPTGSAPEAKNTARGAPACRSFVGLSSRFSVSALRKAEAPDAPRIPPGSARTSPSTTPAGRHSRMSEAQRSPDGVRAAHRPIRGPAHKSGAAALGFRAPPAHSPLGPGSARGCAALVRETPAFASGAYTGHSPRVHAEFQNIHSSCVARVKAWCIAFRVSGEAFAAARSVVAMTARTASWNSSPA